MALDLSTVSEPAYEEVESNSRYVLLASETLAISGSNEILFEVSESGQLFLAQFFVESVNGTCVLRRRSLPLTEHGSQADDVDSIEATNLCVGKSLPENSNSGRFVNGFSASHSEEARRSTALTSSRSDGGPLVAAIPSPANQHPDQTLLTSGFQNAAASCTDSIRVPSDLLGGIVSKLLEQQQQQQQQHRQSANSVSNTSSGARGDVVLSGHNLSELSRFVDQLRDFRHLVGLSQCQLSSELTRHFRNESLFSQPLLSRFEKLNVTVRAAFRLLPYLRTWLSHAEKHKCTSAESNCNSIALSSPLGTPLVACQALGDNGSGGAPTTVLDRRPIRSVGRARLSVLAARMVHQSSVAGLVRSEKQPLGEVEAERSRTSNPSSDPKATLPQPTDTLVCKVTLPDCAHSQVPGPAETSGVDGGNYPVAGPHHSVARTGDGQLTEALSTATSATTPTPTVTAPSCQLSLDEHSRPWRRKRTRFSPATLATLSIAFSRSPHPSSAQLTRLATETGHSRESIRIWFGNRRQLTNQTKSIKKHIPS